MDMEGSRSERSGLLLPPHLLDYLYDNGAAHDLIDTLRWDSAECPRCRSRYIKKVNTQLFRQLYRCIDCGYMFNALAGTIFHGSKMPLCKYLQFFILHNAFQSQLHLRDLSYAIDVSHKTASILMKRVGEIVYPFNFVAIIKEKSGSEPAYKDSHVRGFASFFSYCEIQSIQVSDASFREFVRLLVRGEVAGVDAAESYF